MIHIIIVRQIISQLFLMACRRRYRRGVDTGKADADIEAQDIDDGALTENTDNKDKFRHTKKHKKKLLKQQIIRLIIFCII